MPARIEDQSVPWVCARRQIEGLHFPQWHFWRVGDLPARINYVHAALEFLQVLHDFFVHFGIHIVIAQDDVAEIMQATARFLAYLFDDLDAPQNFYHGELLPELLCGSHLVEDRHQFRVPLTPTQALHFDLARIRAVRDYHIDHPWRGRAGKDLRRGR